MNYIKGIKLREMPAASSYLHTLPVIEYLNRCECLEFKKPVTFFVGENGSGKSTLLEAIAIAMGLNAEGGSRDHSFSTKDTHSELGGLLTVIRTRPPRDSFFLRAEGFYNLSSFLDANSTMLRYGGISFHKQSHGESFLALVQNRFGGQGLYLLDEPEAALSPQRLMSLITVVDNLVKQSSQLVIATHSPILMAYPHAEILQFSEAGIHPVKYRETEHYKITKLFMEEPERMIHYLLGTDRSNGFNWSEG